MTWTLLYAPGARRDLRDLDHEVAQRVVTRLDGLQGEPLRSMKRLKGGDHWVLRVVDWRIICQVDSAGERILILRIRHRSVAYT